MSENLTEKYTYGKTTTLVDTDDIGDMTEAIESVDQEVDTHVEEANAKFSEYDSKIASIESEMSNVKKSVSDGKSLVAGAITNKGVETAADATFETMATNIDSITTIESASANMTAAAGDMLADKTAIVAGKVVVGTIPSKAAATITPGTSNQTIAAGQYLAGDQTVKGDANLVAANIAKGKSIFGVTGTYDPTFSNLTKSSKFEITSITGITKKYGGGGEYTPSYYVTNGTATKTNSVPIKGIIIHQASSSNNTTGRLWMLGQFTDVDGYTTYTSTSYTVPPVFKSSISGYESGTGVTITYSADMKTLTIVASGYINQYGTVSLTLLY